MQLTPRARSVAGIAATAVNFPVVFAGLLAITSQTSGNDEVAMLNLWAFWGIALGLLGQVGLISGVLDRRGWSSPQTLRVAVTLAALGGLIGLAARDSLFPGHPSWWSASALIAAAVYLIGRQRADLTLRAEGTTALVVTALENTVRTAAVVALLVVGFDSSAELRFGALAVVAPFAVSLVVMGRLLTREPADAQVRSRPERVAGSIAAGVLAGVPALAAYAIVPGLTLLDTTDDLDAFAIAGSLLRGPLLVAAFTAPWLLQILLGDSTRRGESLWFVPVALAIAQVIVGLMIDSSFNIELAIHGTFAGLVAASTYLSILRSTDRIDGHRTPLIALGVAVVLYAAVLVVATETTRVHPFLALSASCAIVPVVLRSLSPNRVGAIA